MKMDCLNKNNFPSTIIKEERSAICLTHVVVWVYILFFNNKVGDSTDGIWLDNRG